MQYLAKFRLVILSSCLFVISPSVSWAGGGSWYDYYLAAARVFAGVVRPFTGQPAEGVTGANTPVPAENAATDVTVPPTARREELINEEYDVVSQAPSPGGSAWDEIGSSDYEDGTSEGSMFEVVSNPGNRTPPHNVSGSLFPHEVPHIQGNGLAESPLKPSSQKGDSSSNQDPKRVLFLGKQYTYRCEGNSIYVFDTNTNEAINTIELEDAPVFEQLVDEFLYVATPRYVYIINTQTGALAEVIYDEPPRLENAGAGGMIPVPFEGGEIPYNKDPAAREIPRGNLNPVDVLAPANNLNPVNVLNPALYGDNIEAPLLIMDIPPLPQPSFVENMENPLSSFTTPLAAAAASSTPSTPQITVNVSQRKNKFLSAQDLTNILRWNAPNIETPPVRYKIFRNESLTDLAASVQAKKTSVFQDHNRKKHTTYHYYLVAVMENGQEILINHLSIP